MQKAAVEKRNFLDRPLFDFLDLSWETALYLLFIVAAILTRFWDLGVRTMSHDESLHAHYSWKLYAGQGYQHNPMMHGPFLFHANALVYFLFGVNDFTARIVPALFGVALVGLPYLLRRWMGRTGALLTSALLLISPSFLYYSRYIRNDIYIAVWTVLFLFFSFKYLEERRDIHLYLAAAFLSLAFCTKEVAFIHGFVFGSFFALLALARWLDDRRIPRGLPAFDLAMVMATLALPLLTSFPIKLLGFDPLDYSPAGIARSGSVFLAVVAAAIAIGLWWDRRRWPICAVVFYAIFVVLHTTFFTNGGGIATGFVGALGYWLAQHGVRRGGQPWYYYFVLILLYEFVPFIFSLMGMGYYLSRKGDEGNKGKGDEGNKGKEGKKGKGLSPLFPSFPFFPLNDTTLLFIAFTIYWLLMSILIYSWAGEKMPWMVLHPVLPMIVLTGRFMGQFFERTDWREIWRRGGWAVALLLPLLLFAASALMSATPFQGRSLEELRETASWLAALVVGAILAAILARYVRRLGGRRTLRVVFATAFIVLCLLTVRFSWMANYINYDTAKEFLVYAHGAPGVKVAMRQIEEISRRTVGERQIKVAYDGAWPFPWYLQDYPNATLFGEKPSKQDLDAPVVIVELKNEGRVRPFLGDRYHWFKLCFLWWPAEDYYKGMTLRRLFDELGDPAKRAELWNVVFHRRYPRPLNDWYYRNDFYFCMRKDMLNQLWDFAVGPAPPVEVAEEPYAEGRVEATAILTWGSQGTGDGQFQDPRDVAVDKEGNVYVVDSGNHRIQKFDAHGHFLAQWGGQGNGPGQFREPWGIAVADDGSVYVADTWNHRIQKFDSEGRFLLQWGTYGATEGTLGAAGVFWGPRDVAIDAEGNVYVTDTGNKRVQKFDPKGKFLGQWGGGGVLDGQMDEPVGIAIDEKGNIYIADTWNQRVQKFDKDFNFLTKWPIRGWYGQSVVNKPYLAAKGGRVYVTDPEGYRVLVFDQEGKFLATFGEYGYDASSFALPIGIALDAEGNIYVVDSANHRVMKFAPLP